MIMDDQGVWIPQEVVLAYPGMLEETTERHQNIVNDNGQPGWYSNREPHEYKLTLPIKRSISHNMDTETLMPLSENGKVQLTSGPFQW